MDLDEVANELYALRPADFTTVRSERAEAARQAGDRQLAARISALRRPTLAAWASNLLVRRHPEQVEPLLRLGEGLRRAHRELDGDQLRELGGRQRRLVHALSQQARALAAQAGQPVGEDAAHEVEDTLRSALADPDAAQVWAAGRLTKALSAPVGFAEAAGVEVRGAVRGAVGEAASADAAAPVPRPATTRRGRGTRGPAGRASDLDGTRRESELRQRHEQLDRACREAAAAEHEASAREEDLATARRTLERAESRYEETEAQVAELTERLRTAERGQRSARGERDQARKRIREADQAAREARRRARDAAAHAQHLADQFHQST